MGTLHLYELTEQFQALNALLDSDDMPPETVLDTLEGVEGEFKLKAVAVAHVIMNMETMAANIEEALKKRKERAERLKARAISLRNYLQFNMQATSITRVEHEDFTISVKKNPPSVYVVDEALIPAEFRIQPPAPPERIDRSAIARAIKAGAEVPGAHLQASERVSIDI